MSDDNDRQEMPACVVRVREGFGHRASCGSPIRLFTVSLNRPAGPDMAIVATAVDPDPDKKAAIPEPGSPHPHAAGYAAKPPEIHPVGLRHAGGAMIARESCFYNVRVRYAAVDSTAMDNGQRTMDSDVNCQLSTVNCEGVNCPLSIANCAPERSEP